MNAAQLINQTSGKTEYRTDPRIISAAREVMGGIDLDPASSAEFNLYIRAKNFFTKKDDGLKHDWFGRTWLNHPFSLGWKACTHNCKRKTCIKRGFHVYEDIPSNADWINKLERAFALDNFVTEACCITFACTSEAWFRPLFKYPKCWLHPRTNYILPSGEILRGVTKGSVVSYLGANIERFITVFRPLGSITIPAP